MQSSRREALREAGGLERRPCREGRFDLPTDVAVAVVGPTVATGKLGRRRMVSHAQNRLPQIW
jgi:hypothetical protein